MRGRWLLMSVLLLGLMLGVVVGLSMAQGGESEDGAAPQALVGTGFTYQGRLNKSGSPYTGQCDFRFSLHDALSGGNQVGNTQTIAGVDVDAGLFTVVLNSGGQFGGSAFNGEGRWLKIQVQCAGDVGYTILNPRQMLTPAPYALALPGLRTQQNATSPNVIGGHSANSANSGVEGATIGGGGASGTVNQVTDDYGVVAGGRGNRAGDNAGTTNDNVYAAIGGGLNNYASASYSTIAGGYGNLVAGNYATIGGGGRTDPGNLGTGNRVSDEYGTVSGGGDNQAGDGDADPTNAAYATVSGGGGNGASGYADTVGGGSYNYASGHYSTVGGGYSNDASDLYSTVGGGLFNEASGGSSTVGGGYENTASGGGSTVAGGRYNHSGHFSAVGGGWGNAASDLYSTVGGGWGNAASGESATVGGGESNDASVNYATIPGGFNASASHWGQMAYASGSFDSPGDAQTSVYVLRNTTTNATPTELFLDGYDDRLTIDPTATVAFDILVVARSTGDNSAGYIMRGLIENDDGWTHFVGAPTATVLGEDRPDWGVGLSAGDVHDVLVINVTGEAGYTIRWVATVRTVEVGH